ncbi:MAG: class IV adenylate cyclase [Phycisphaera sp.]|nr:class IV adenylate cyclase [Phycisphaera sp.]
MAVEIESKTRVTDREALVATLRELAGEPVADVITSDAFFDTPGRDLMADDRGLRLRLKKDATTGAVLKSIVTYKGARAAGPLKRREEIETPVTDADAAAAIFDRLGYPRTVSYDKRRTTWKLDGCAVELDRVPLLGDFVEIEGPDADTIRGVQAKLGIADHEHLTDSYIAMLVAELERRGITAEHIGIDFAD